MIVAGVSQAGSYSKDQTDKRKKQKYENIRITLKIIAIFQSDLYIHSAICMFIKLS